MKTVYVDTSHLLALSLNRDAHHDIATRLQLGFEGRMVTTDYVLVEFADALCSGNLRLLVIQAIEGLQNDPLVEVVPASRQLQTAGLAMFRSRPDKSWSLTDCISFVVMKEREITESFTADHHLEQAGFRALLRAAM